MNSASLCSLEGRYDNPIPPRFLAPIDSLKIPAQEGLVCNEETEDLEARGPALIGVLAGLARRVSRAWYAQWWKLKKGPSVPPGLAAAAQLRSDKKENQIFLIYQEIQNRAVAKSYMT
jgi:hypothetical protein